MIVIVLALAILAWAMLQFRFANTQLLPNSERNDALVTNGVFALTRNPMYLAMTVFCIGGALWFGRLPMLLAPALMFAVANWVFIPFEEAKMRRQFGETFDAYTRRVRRWI
jgi:protein-S-isoprenylcysteine O-methyltransferase Ste14